MTRRTAFMLAAGTLALAALLAWAFVPRAVTVEAARVGVGPFEAGIDEEGRTRLRNRYVVSAPVAGRLQRPTLREGDAVLFAILCASGSYIAVPAAFRAALPAANPSVYVGLALGVTFPFNLLVGIPLAYSIIHALWA